jgi:hypothetical protein
MSTAGLFEPLAARYDAWYESPAGAAVFPAEAACLRPLLDGLPGRGPRSASAAAGSPLPSGWRRAGSGARPVAPVSRLRSGR